MIFTSSSDMIGVFTVDSLLLTAWIELETSPGGKSRNAWTRKRFPAAACCPFVQRYWRLFPRKIRGFLSLSMIYCMKCTHCGSSGCVHWGSWWQWQWQYACFFLT